MKKEIILFLALALFVGFYSWLKYKPRHNIKSLLKPHVFNLKIDENEWTRAQLNLKIDSLLSMGNCNDAEQKIDSLLDLNDKDYKSLDYRGLVFLCKDNPKKSIIWFNKSIQFGDSNYLGALAHRAEAYMHLRMFDSAISDLKKCIKVNYDFTKNLGLVYERANIPDSAIKYYKIFLMHYPDSLNIQNSLNKLNNRLSPSGASISLVPFHKSLHQSYLRHEDPFV